MKLHRISITNLNIVRPRFGIECSLSRRDKLNQICIQFDGPINLFTYSIFVGSNRAAGTGTRQDDLCQGSQTQIVRRTEEKF